MLLRSQENQGYEAIAFACWEMGDGVLLRCLLNFNAI